MLISIVFVAAANHGSKACGFGACTAIAVGAVIGAVNTAAHTPDHDLTVDDELSHHINIACCSFFEDEHAFSCCEDGFSGVRADEAVW